MTTPAPDDATTRAARAELERLRRETDAFSSAAAAQSAPPDGGRPDPSDPVEVWATRVGRGLAVVFAVGVVVWFVVSLWR